MARPSIRRALWEESVWDRGSTGSREVFHARFARVPGSTVVVFSPSPSRYSWYSVGRWDPGGTERILSLRDTTLVLADAALRCRRCLLPASRRGDRSLDREVCPCADRQGGCPGYAALRANRFSHTTVTGRWGSVRRGNHSPPRGFIPAGAGVSTVNSRKAVSGTRVRRHVPSCREDLGRSGAPSWTPLLFHVEHRSSLCGSTALADPTYGGGTTPLWGNSPLRNDTPAHFAHAREPGRSREGLCHSSILPYD